MYIAILTLGAIFISIAIIEEVTTQLSKEYSYDFHFC